MNTRTDTRPNIVLLFPDQWRHDALSVLGHPVAETPFLDQIAHQGVRLGRSVHVVDMADRDSRATYTALSNSVIGLVLLAAGIFGAIAQWLGIGVVLAIFTLMAALAMRAAAGLDEVQEE